MSKRIVRRGETLKNIVEINGKTAKITIKSKTHGEVVVLVDVEDVEKLMQNGYSLTLSYCSKRKKYRVKTKQNIDGKPIDVYLYRFLLNAPSGMVVDHINHNELDNRKSNLRITTNSINLQNRQGADRDSKSGHRNVWWNKRDEVWCVSVRHKNKHYTGGRYKNIHDAVKAASVLRERVFTNACTAECVNELCPMIR
jgi:hypothetical protein